MDFYKLKQYQDECNLNIKNIADIYNLNFEDVKILCREIGFQTRYSYSEAIEKTRVMLDRNYSITDIKNAFNISY